MSENENKGCGEEGHVCICGVDDQSVIAPKNPMMSLEDFLLMRLELDLPQEPSMAEMIGGALVVITQCIQFVKITEKHDEIAGALKKAVSALDEMIPDGAGFHKMFALVALMKLEAEKGGRAPDWEYCNKLAPGSPFLMEEMKRVWG
jgi:hypothetical protein